MRRQAVAAAASAMLAITFVRGGTAPSADLSITNTDFAPTYTPGGTTTYTIVVGNAGPDAVAQAAVSDPVTSSPQVTAASWTCVAAGGATCAAGTLAGNISDTVDLPVGGTATYTLLVSLNSTATGNLASIATVTPPSGTNDPGPGLNTATDTDALAGLLYVAASTGIDSPTCGASTTPCKTIQAAIDLASAGDTVVVQKGTYNECIVLVPGIGPGGVRVESDEHLASRANAATILDGKDLCGGTNPVAGPIAKVYDGSSLIGFTIQNGGSSGVWGLGAVAIVDNVFTTNATTSTGGGLYLSTGVNLSNPLGRALIQSNAILANTSAGDGGGIFVDATADGIPSLVEIIGNTISGNTAGDGSAGALGGGIAVLTDTVGAADVSRVVIAGNTLDGNIANNATGDATVADGGGLFVGTGAVSGAGTETITIGGTGRGNNLRNNLSHGLGGGLTTKLQPGSSGTHDVSVSANRFTANTSKLGGGGAHLWVHAIDRAAGASPDLALHVSGNTFIGNHAQGTFGDPNAAGGGGLYAELHSDRSPAAAVTFEIFGNTIESNDASPHGGGASLLANADDDPTSSGTAAPADAFLSFHNNLVVENAAHDTSVSGVSGGAVHALAEAWGALSHVQFLQDFLTVTNNQTEIGSGGFEWEERPPPQPLRSTGTTLFSLSNSIVSGNDGFGVGGTIIPDGIATTVTVAYTDAFGNGTADYEAQLGVIVDGTVNFSQDPTLDAYFLPRLCGPTIDRGDPTIPATNEPEPNGARVNLGHAGNTASAPRTFADVNGDGTVDGLDLLGIAASFGASSPDPRYFTAADRNGNGMVDGDDLSFVAMFYAQSCP